MGRLRYCERVAIKRLATTPGDQSLDPAVARLLVRRGMITCSGFEIVESPTGAYKHDRYRLTHRGRHVAGTLRSWHPRGANPLSRYPRLVAPPPPDPPTAAELEEAAARRARAARERVHFDGLLKGLSAKYGHLTEEQLVRLREEVARAPAS